MGLDSLKKKKSSRAELTVRRRKKSRGLTGKVRKRNGPKRKKNKNIIKRLKQKKSVSKVLFQNLKLVLVIVLITGVSGISGMAFFYSLTRVSGYSMMPTLSNQDILLIEKRTKLERFDIVLIKKGNEGELRRVIGLPGENIEYKKDVLYVDGQPLDEKFIVDKINDNQKLGKNFTEDFNSATLTNKPVIIKNNYLVLGDNRPYTTDSRDYGLVTVDQIVGKVNARIWPFEEDAKF